MRTSKKKSDPTASREIVTSKKPTYWVGIGASAGGLEALRVFVSRLPTDAPITYIVAQHLSPQHRSMLPELIKRETSLQVKEVQDNTAPQANVVYITPPNKDVVVSDGILKLLAPKVKTGHPKPSVDRFLASLSKELEDHAIGIILSGTGSDGAHGMKLIRAAGGITIAQDEHTAKYFGMPGSAVQLGGVDLVLPPDQIGEKILKIIQQPRNFDNFVKPEEVQTNALEKLLHRIQTRQGVNFKEYKPNTIHRRIERRMKACNHISIESYCSFASDNPTEQDLLFKDLLISVTSFFRDDTAFDALKNAIEDIVKNRTLNEPVRVWIPGCCTGEEAYSISILLAEALGGLHALTTQAFQVFATDVDETSLTIARLGHYPEALLEDMPCALRERYFYHNGINYEVIKPLRDRIAFSRHNVAQDPPFLRIDLISCRNLLIYFNQNLQDHVLKLFHYSISHKGYLFLGRSENISAQADLYQVVDGKEKLFRRKIGLGQIPNFSAALHPIQARLSQDPQRKEGHDLKALSDALIRTMAPHSMIVNETLDIKRVYGDIKPFATFEAGDTRMNVCTLIEDSYRQEIRALVFKAGKEELVQRGRPRTLMLENAPNRLTLITFPLSIKGTDEKLLLVVFDLHPISADEMEALPEAGTDDPRLSQLEQELKATREHLQTVIEELETSNEELQSLNEELQSSNEELQSTNEELETSNEELQSTNEELTTVNEELHVKSSQLIATNEDLYNVMESLKTPLLVVDKDLRITRFNKTAFEVFEESLLGRGELVTSIPMTIDAPSLKKVINQAIAGAAPQSTLIHSEPASYRLNVFPYYDIHKVVNGAILLFADQTELLQKNAQLPQPKSVSD